MPNPEQSERLLALAARVEAAEPAMQNKIISDAWELLAEASASFRRFACEPSDSFGTRAGHFGAMLDAHAFVEAASMLIPWGMSHMEVHTPDHQSLGWTVRLVAHVRYPLPFPVSSGFATSHALALTAASLRARASAGDGA